MSAYYNEHDKFAAQWLRNLIAAGHIAPGDVDERDIRDVRPSDLAGYTQCHFFAGIGVWSLALRNAGWPDSRRVWTGSGPCQPFSAAGRGEGFADERHLWPHWHWLISQCRPDVVFGEQVASRDGLAWLDLVQSDLEGSGYAGGAVDLCAAGVGAPHIRQRLYIVADRVRAGWAEGRPVAWQGSLAGSSTGELVHHHHPRPQGYGGDGDGSGQPGRVAAFAPRSVGPSGAVGSLADKQGERRQRRPHDEDGGRGQLASGRERATGGLGVSDSARPQSRGQTATADGRGHSADATGGGNSARPTDGFWRDADWLLCRDGKWRPVEPGTFPLAHGVASRVGKLRAYGNAIVERKARAFIEAYIDADACRNAGLIVGS